MTNDTTELPIFLVGFMGCGKSAVGAALAIRLAWPFVDLDSEIERAAQQSIADLIIERGEDEFRRIESEVLTRVGVTRAGIIATGGGVVLSQANRQLMKDSGTTIWLDAPFELCWLRIGGDRSIRPLAPDRETALTRYDDRLRFYREANLRVEIDDQMQPDLVATIILRQLENSRE